MQHLPDRLEMQNIKDEKVYVVGKITGDAISTVAGAISTVVGASTFFGGILGEAAGITMSSSGAASLLGIPVVVIYVSAVSTGAAVATAGAEVTKTSIGSLGKDLHELFKKSQTTGGGYSNKDTWDMPEEGKTINGRKYSKHALERMAPDTPSVRAELSRRAEKIVKQKGISVNDKNYYQEVNKYVQPRNIPPMVIENIIKTTKGVPGKEIGTVEHITEDIRIILNLAGDVITVYAK